jgi:hypothetical protein
MNQKGSKNRRVERLGQTFVGRQDRYDNNKELDIYETNPIYLDDLFKYEEYKKDGTYYEPCWGINKYLYNKLKVDGYDVYGTDIIDGGDFLKCENKYDYIITNPPFNLNLEFINKAFEVANKKISFLVPLNYLDTMKRYEVFHNPDFPCKNVLIYSKRISFIKGGGLPEKCITGMSFCWITWEKGYIGETTIKWIKNF